MNKHRILSFITALALCVTISGCSANNAAPADTIEAAVTTAPVSSEISETGFTEAPVIVSSENAETTAAATSETIERKSGLRYEPGKGALSDEPDQPVRRKANTVKQIVGTMYNGEAVNSNFYYYRCMLNDSGKTAYDVVHAGLLTGASTISMSTPLSVSDVDIVYYSILYDDPSIVWAEPGYSYYYNNSGYVTSISPQYNYLVKDISGTKKKLENSVSKILSIMWSLPNNIERSKYAHDYLTHTIDYVENDLDQNAYSALVQHKTVCAGYSQAFAYMMQKMGAPCAVIAGYAGENHAWNIVTLNGESYVTDVTWDDPTGNPPDTYYYDYFNITSAQMSRDHTLQSPSTYLAPATGTYASYNNYFRGNAYGTDFDDPAIINADSTAVTTPVTSKPSVTTTKPATTTTQAYATTPGDWDSYWNDDWWSDWGITISTTKPPTTTTKPQVTTTKPSVTTTKPDVTMPDDWDSYWNDDWWSDWGITISTTKPPTTTTKPQVTTTKPSVTTTKPSVTTTKPSVTTASTTGASPYNWDDDWFNDNSWDWSWYNDDYDSWDIDMSDYDYSWSSDGSQDYSDYFDDYSYYIGDSSSSGWWSYLDPYWKKSDWTFEGDGLWTIEDSETGYLYLYDEDDGTFYCADEDGTIYMYNERTDKWVKV